MPPDFGVEPLGSHHDRAAFSCGSAQLDDFIKTKARREHDLGYCAVFILVAVQGARTIAGYYSLSSHSIALDGIDEASRRKIPRYPNVPTTLIGRLARDLRFRGTGADGFLLMDALRRARQSSRQVGSYAVIVDAIDDDAAVFYSKFGFLPLIGHANRLYLSMASIERLGL
jgi:hypothetical protein